MYFCSLHLLHRSTAPPTEKRESSNLFYKLDMLCYYLACSFCKIDLNLEVISFTELVFCAWPRTRMSTDESRALNQQSSTRSRRGFSRRAGSCTRSRQGFSWRVKTRTRSRRGFFRRAKTRARTRRVVLSPRPTALLTCQQSLEVPCFKKTSCTFSAHKLLEKTQIIT